MHLDREIMIQIITELSRELGLLLLVQAKEEMDLILIHLDLGSIQALTEEMVLLTISEGGKMPVKTLMVLDLGLMTIT